MDLIQRTIDLAKANVERGGRPFACIVARGNEIIAEAVNLVAQTHDPTAHAEIRAILEASQSLGTEHFTGCEFYILAHPCPMCLAAMYYCSPDRVVFITTRDDYSRYYVDDGSISRLRTSTSRSASRGSSAPCRWCTPPTPAPSTSTGAGRS
jgi:tRNA(Arg) A34 adenosine deaminase TadA